MVTARAGPDFFPGQGGRLSTDLSTAWRLAAVSKPMDRGGSLHEMAPNCGRPGGAKCGGNARFVRDSSVLTPACARRTRSTTLLTAETWLTRQEVTLAKRISVGLNHRAFRVAEKRPANGSRPQRKRRPHSGPRVREFWRQNRIPESSRLPVCRKLRKKRGPERFSLDPVG
jgi:hypothetical protein